MFNLDFLRSVAILTAIKHPLPSHSVEGTPSSQPKDENEPISERNGSALSQSRLVNVAAIGSNLKPKQAIGGAAAPTLIQIGGAEKDSSGPGTLKKKAR